MENLNVGNVNCKTEFYKQKTVVIEYTLVLVLIVVIFWLYYLCHHHDNLGEFIDQINNL